MGISEQLSGPFNLSAVEGDSRILMGLFYQRAAGPCSGSRQGEREAYRDSERERVCVCVRLIILTPPSDSTGEVPCQMIQHRLLSSSRSPLFFLASSFYSVLSSFLFFKPLYLPPSNVHVMLLHTLMASSLFFTQAYVKEYFTEHTSHSQ